MPGQKLLSSHRLAYDVMVRQIEQNGQYIVNNEQKAGQLNKKNIRAAQSYLWSEIPLNPNNSSYQFNVRNGVANLGQPGIVPGENRLKDQDVFFAYGLGFYMRVLSTNMANTAFQNQLFTFPSANFYGSLQIERMLGLWTEGQLVVKTNGETLTPSWDMGQHLVIPQTQVLAAPGPSSTAPFYDQEDLASDGVVITEPNWIINGGNDNNYTVNYPNNFVSFQLPDPTTTNWRVSLVMKWQGFLAQNASSIMNNAPAKG